LSITKIIITAKLVFCSNSLEALLKSPRGIQDFSIFLGALASDLKPFPKQAVSITV
tara:strand:+ start:288 stop:455 length:168 start_codon:yes stop_codon:yes gene_type:complete